MPNYKEQAGIGTTWTRSQRVTCTNGHNRRSIWYDEERVMIGPDGRRMSATEIGMGVGKDLTEDNANTVFAWLDVDSNPTGRTLTYQDAYLVLMSLYYHLANERDQAEAADNV